MMEKQVFSSYMREALYGADGYYTKDAIRFGKMGDFYTSAQVSPLFGYLFATHVADQHDASKDVVVTEIGCGDGGFALPFLYNLLTQPTLQNHRIRYLAIDRSLVALSRTKEKIERGLGELGEQARERLSLFFHASVQDLPEDLTKSFQGTVVIANEWLDALPVEILRLVSSEKLEQVVVGSKDERTNHPRYASSTEQAAWFEETTDPLLFTYRDRYILPWLDEIQFPVIVEAQTEIESALSLLVQKLAPEHFILIDYGGYTIDLLSSDRPNGTLRAYRAHQLVDDFLDQTGFVDLTYDVDFSVVTDVLQTHHYEVDRVTRQGAFLLRLPGLMASLENYARNYADGNLAIKQLMMGGLMGDRFMVLTARKAGEHQDGL